MHAVRALPYKLVNFIFLKLRFLQDFVRVCVQEERDGESSCVVVSVQRRREKEVEGEKRRPKPSCSSSDGHGDVQVDMCARIIPGIVCLW